jgi:hypothetical protein
MTNRRRVIVALVALLVVMGSISVVSALMTRHRTTPGPTNRPNLHTSRTIIDCMNGRADPMFHHRSRVEG